MWTDSSDILEAKKSWMDSGFLGGAITITFFQMQEQRLDIVFDQDNECVMEYVSLLKRRLGTNDRRIILMVNTEIERACFRFNDMKCFDGEEWAYFYLIDEINAHFHQATEQYPLTAVGLHIDIIKSLCLLNMPCGVIYGI